MAPDGFKPMPLCNYTGHPIGCDCGEPYHFSHYITHSWQYTVKPEPPKKTNHKPFYRNLKKYKKP